MSEIRRSVARVRQLSLQPATPRRWQLRRQKTEDEKSSQIYGDNNGSGRNRGNSRSVSSRPKVPVVNEVRVAWGERHRENDSIEHVEVVARQITGRSKSASRKSRNRSIIGNEEKASILYSRQELTERLRLAWKHREENKANIDIFLAHGVVEERCDSASSNYAAATESQTNDRHLITDHENVQALRVDGTCENSTTKRTEFLEGKTNLEKELNETKRSKKTKILEESPNIEETSSTTHENGITCSETDERTKCMENEANEMLEGTIEIKNEAKTSVGKEQAKLPTVISTAGIVKTQNDVPSAKQKRANFRSGTNRAFLYAETDKIGVSRTSVGSVEIPPRLNSIERSVQSRRTPEIKQSIVANGSHNTIKGATDRKCYRKSRSSSAPLQGRPGSRVQVNIVIDTPCGTQQKNTDEFIQKEKANEEDVVDKKKEIVTKTSYVRPIRSAPIKRRLKNLKKRQHSLGSSCKDEQCNGSSGRCGISTKDCEGKSNDVVTMVSLVSSTESDSDLENSPNEAKLISQLREKLATTPIIKSSTTPIPGGNRKPVKSVSFQRDSIDEDSAPTKLQFTVKTKNNFPQNRFTLVKDPDDLGESYNTGKESILWKSSEIRTALPVLSFVQDESESLCAPLMEHDMRSLAVPIGNVDEIRKKPHRTRNTSTLTAPEKKITTTEMKKDNELDNQLLTRRSTMPAKSLLPNVNSSVAVSSREESTDTIPIETEPPFQTRKEKDCWHLYKRMCDKGVHVSFDTVLRGMLTPTEYRLRQKEYSQDL